MAALHEATFTWPDTNATDVILTGTFDQWSSSTHLTKGSSGFTGKISIPWGEKIEYKFIVDGRWTICDGQPTESDPSGEFVNNAYQAPPKPEPATNGVASTLAEASPSTVTEVQATIYAPVAETTEKETATSTVPETLKEAGDIVVAQKGTSSTFGYLTSGIGAAIKTFVGVDPVNQDKVPVESSATEPSVAEFPIIESPVVELPVIESPIVETVPVETSPPVPDKSVTEIVTDIAPPAEVAPDIPITIVPVKDATTDDLAPFTNTPAPLPAEPGTIEASTHTPAIADAPPAEPAQPPAPVVPPKPTEISFPSSESPHANGASSTHSPGKFDTARKKRHSIFGKLHALPSTSGDDSDGSLGSDSQRRRRTSSIFGKIKSVFTKESEK